MIDKIILDTFAEGFEPTTYRLKAGYSAIELMECLLARTKILANSACKKTANLIKDKRSHNPCILFCLTVLYHTVILCFTLNERMKPNHPLLFSESDS